MTISAIGSIIIAYKFTLVKIIVTISATGMCDRIRHFVFMTFSAIHDHMLSCQRIICQVMVELIEMGKGMERFFVVTFFTIDAEFVIMNIFMTRDTTLKIFSPVIEKYLVGPRCCINLVT